MKTCLMCQSTKPKNQFSQKKTGVFQSYCRVCDRKRARENYYKNHKRYKEVARKGATRRRNEKFKRIRQYLLKNPCVDCGESDLRTLEFDHIHGDKEGNVTQMVGQCASWNKILKEIDKCQVRCSNCHKKRHYKTGTWRS